MMIQQSPISGTFPWLRMNQFRVHQELPMSHRGSRSLEEHCSKARSCSPSLASGPSWPGYQAGAPGLFFRAPQVTLMHSQESEPPGRRWVCWACTGGMGFGVQQGIPQQDYRAPFDCHMVHLTVIWERGWPCEDRFLADSKPRETQDQKSNK